MCKVNVFVRGILVTRNYDWHHVLEISRFTRLGVNGVVEKHLNVKLCYRRPL